MARLRPLLLLLLLAPGSHTHVTFHPSIRSAASTHLPFPSPQARRFFHFALFLAQDLQLDRSTLPHQLARIPPPPPPPNTPSATATTPSTEASDFPILHAEATTWLRFPAPPPRLPAARPRAAVASLQLASVPSQATVLRILREFFSATGGETTWRRDTAQSWLADDKFCFWRGVICVFSLGGQTELRALFLSGQGVSGRIPESLTEITTLVSLVFSYNPITQLPDSLDRMEQLLTLDVRGCLLEDLPASVSLLPNLQDLNVDAQTPPLTSIPDLHPSAPMIQFTASENDLTRLPAMNLRNLTMLDVSHNLLTELDLEGAPLLESVNISYNELSELPFFPSTHLVELKAFFNKIRTLHPGWTASDSALPLRSLLFSFNELDAQLVDTFPWHRLPSLDLLDLNHNPIGNLSSSVGAAANISYLFLRDCALKTLPDSLTQMEHLLLLDVSENRFSSLPPVLNNLQHLSILDVSSNQLTAWQVGVAANALGNLQILHAQHNQLRFETFFCELPRLTFLHLAYNNFELLVCNTRGSQFVGPIEYLNASHNHIEHALTLGMIPHIRTFDISFNQLIEFSTNLLSNADRLPGDIPPDPSSGLNLEYIDVSNNMIDSDSINALLLFSRPMEFFFKYGSLLYFRATDNPCLHFYRPMNSHGDAMSVRDFEEGSGAFLSDQLLRFSNEQPQLDYVCRTFYYTGPKMSRLEPDRLSFVRIPELKLPVYVDPEFFDFRHCYLPARSFPLYADNASRSDISKCTNHQDLMQDVAHWKGSPTSALRCPNISLSENPCGSSNRAQRLPEFRCAEGYDADSFLCSHCIDGYAKAGRRCVECQSFVSWLLPALYVIIVLSFVLYVLSEVNFERATAKILLFHLQLLGLLTLSTIPWPNALLMAFNVSGQTTFDLAVFGCIVPSVGSGFRSRFVVTMLLPVCSAVFCIAVYAMGAAIMLMQEKQVCPDFLYALTCRGCCGQCRERSVEHRYQSSARAAFRESRMTMSLAESVLNSDSSPHSSSLTERLLTSELAGSVQIAPDPRDPYDDFHYDLPAVSAVSRAQQSSHGERSSQADDPLEPSTERSDISDDSRFNTPRVDPLVPLELPITTRLKLWRWKCFHLFCFALVVLYTPICMQVFSAFAEYRDAAHPDVSGRMLADPDIQWGSSTFKKYETASIIAAFVYVLGIPFFFYRTLRYVFSHKPAATPIQLDDHSESGGFQTPISAHDDFDVDDGNYRGAPTVPVHTAFERALLFGCFFSCYKVRPGGFVLLRHGQWEFVVMFRKLCVALTISLLSSNSVVAPVITFLLLLTSLVLTLNIRPYRHYYDNLAEIISLFVLTMTFVYGLLLHNADIRHVEKEVGGWFMFLSNAGFIVFMMWRQALRSSIKLKSLRVPLFLW